MRSTYSSYPAVEDYICDTRLVTPVDAMRNRVVRATGSLRDAAQQRAKERLERLARSKSATFCESYVRDEENAL